MEKDSGRNSSGKAESHPTPVGRGTPSGISGEHGLSAAEGGTPTHTSGEHGLSAAEGGTPTHTSGEHGLSAAEGGTPTHTSGEHGLSAAEGKRTRTLEALCILSFVGSGAGLLLWLCCGIFFPQAENILRSLTDLTATQKLTSAYFLIFSLFSAISLSGVLLMWRGRMIGFPVYTAAQVMIVSWPLVMLGKSGFSSVSLLFSILFIILYANEMMRLRRSVMRRYSLEKSRMFSR